MTTPLDSAAAAPFPNKAFLSSEELFSLQCPKSTVAGERVIFVGIEITYRIALEACQSPIPALCRPLLSKQGLSILHASAMAKVVFPVKEKVVLPLPRLCKEVCTMIKTRVQLVLVTSCGFS